MGIRITDPLELPHRKCGRASATYASNESALTDSLAPTKQLPCAGI